MLSWKIIDENKILQYNREYVCFIYLFILYFHKSFQICNMLSLICQGHYSIHNADDH